MDARDKKRQEAELGKLRKDVAVEKVMLDQQKARQQQQQQPEA